ncbi:hypothetical protein RIF29_19101 [Crotalaria pallida]|uniref:DUF1997 family protein n=1 Tax=Crotalaria pallida TaxID=3830 RepID=A0AAN9EZE6_CROPI
MANILLLPCQLKLLKNHKLHRHCHTKTVPISLNSVIRNERTSSFSYRGTANVPFNELPGASFDQYMDNKQRVFQAVFPDKATTKQLNEEEWRIKLPTLQSIFLNVQPTADIRLTFKSNGEDYPHDIPHHITTVLEFQFIRWELLQGPLSMEPNLSLDVRGAIYPERTGRSCWLKNEMEMKISFCVSPIMSLVPEKIIQDGAELIFKKMMDEMKKDFQGRLVADYRRFKRSKSLKNSV